MSKRSVVVGVSKVGALKISELGAELFEGPAGISKCEPVQLQGLPSIDDRLRMMVAEAFRDQVHGSGPLGPEDDDLMHHVEGDPDLEQMTPAELEFKLSMMQRRKQAEEKARKAAAFPPTAPAAPAAPPAASPPAVPAPQAV